MIWLILIAAALIILGGVTRFISKESYDEYINSEADEDKVDQKEASRYLFGAGVGVLIIGFLVSGEEQHTEIEPEIATSEKPKIPQLEKRSEKKTHRRNDKSRQIIRTRRIASV